MHCKSGVGAQELQTLLWVWINVLTPHQNGGFCHYLGLFFSMLSLCFPRWVPPGEVPWLCGGDLLSSPSWVWLLSFAAAEQGCGLTALCASAHWGFLRLKGWLCSLYHCYLHWVLWKVWVQLLAGRSGAECVSLILVRDLTRAQERSDGTFLTWDMCLMWLVTACCWFV